MAEEMNERIRELIKQTSTETPYYPAGCNGYPSYHYDFDKEKFAELIVRECTNMLPNDSIRNEEGVHMFYVIREHFGVPVIGR